MSAFESEEDIDWQAIDATALITSSGIATVRDSDSDACLRVLAEAGYTSSLLDLGGGFEEVRRRLDELFSWEEQFGYRLADHKGAPNLDALRDGFSFELNVAHPRHVLRVDHADDLWRINQRWVSGFLAITSEHSRFHLALGHRFFGLLSLPEGSELIGAPFEQLSIPCFWQRTGGDPRGVSP